MRQLLTNPRDDFLAFLNRQFQTVEGRIETLTLGCDAHGAYYRLGGRNEIAGADQCECLPIQRIVDFDGILVARTSPPDRSCIRSQCIAGN